MIFNKSNFLTSRHGWDNYDDQVTYDQDYAQIEYRERTQAQTKDCYSQSATEFKN